jgi:hypothetical protein
MRNLPPCLLLLAFSAAMSLAQLNGIVDIHTHGDPDSAPRKIDVLEFARLAKSEGMRAIVLKNHYAPTVQAAYLVRQVVPGIEVFGGIALNRSVGGVNPAAVEQAAAFKGKYLRIVWMPTFDSENQVRFSKQNRPSVSVSRDGHLLPEVVEVMKIIKKESVALATGHSSAAEDLMLVSEARKLGITKIVVTHPLNTPVEMAIPQMQEAAKMGAFLEFCAGSILPSAQDSPLKVADYVKAIRAVGPEHAILSSDLGQPANPVHTEGWKQYLVLLSKAGISDREIDLMARRNPAQLLGLPEK